MRAKWISIILAFLIQLSTLSAATSIDGTAHDLTAVGGGNTCSFCHTPHGALAGTPLWNHKLSTAVYKIYQSSSLQANPGQPTGSSKLCLSCHDGTVALSETVTGGGAGGAYIAPGAANLGTDLSDDHPISFVYSSTLAQQDDQIKSPSMLPQQLKLDRAGELQCTTCHDAHNDQYGKFLVMSNRRSAMCVSCHDLRDWITSSHESSAASVLGSSDPYLKNSKNVSVMDNGCECCHRPHSAGGHQRLLHFPNISDNCLSCHDGSVAQTNLRQDLYKISRHDVTRYESIHDLKESPLTMPMHVECVDCHNAHTSQNTIAQAPFAKGSIKGTSGITASGGFTEQVQYEYEICFKCHADNPNRIESKITRQISQTNTRLEFDPSNPSFHPVETPGVNHNVPSLVLPMTVTTMIYCTDCHSSDSASGTKGPHGSNYSPLLSNNYQTSDFTSESSFAYDLCYKCHSRNSILNNESFPRHKTHIVDQKAPCSACHDAHGINGAQGTATNNTNLINFDISIVQSGPSGPPTFQTTGLFHGQCSLTCHNKEHNALSY